MDGKKKLDLLGAWWKCQNSTAAGVRVDVRTEYVDVGRLVMVVAWEGTIFQIPLALKR